jgi:hypothetical protein
VLLHAVGHTRVAESGCRTLRTSTYGSCVMTLIGGLGRAECTVDIASRQPRLLCELCRNVALCIKYNSIQQGEMGSLPSRKEFQSGGGRHKQKKELRYRSTFSTWTCREHMRGVCDLQSTRCRWSKNYKLGQKHQGPCLIPHQLGVVGKTTHRFCTPCVISGSQIDHECI